MERDYDTPEGKEAGDDETYMMPMEQRDPMMWSARQDTLLTKPKKNDNDVQKSVWIGQPKSQTFHFLREAAQKNSIWDFVLTCRHNPSTQEFRTPKVKNHEKIDIFHEKLICLEWPNIETCFHLKF